MKPITPPSSPDSDESIHIEDIVPIDDMEEMINFSDDDMSDEEEHPKIGLANCVFRSHTNVSVFCGCLNKNGKLAATGGEEDKAYMWDTTTGEIVLDCTGHKDSVFFVEFNHDESYLATGDMSGIVQVWKLADKTKIWEYNMGDATWMKWHPVANVLFGGSVSGETYMWKVPDGDCKVFQGHGCRAEVGVVFPDGKRIAVGYEDGMIKTIDLRNSSVISSLPSPLNHSGTIISLDCHSDNNRLLSASEEGKTIISTSTSGKIVAVLQNFTDHSTWTETAVFCKDPTFQVAASATCDRQIFIWDISKLVLRDRIVQECGASKLLWKGNTHILFSAGLDGNLRCFDARTGQCLRTFLGHTTVILDLYISENGEKALTTSDDSTARIYDISSVC